MVEREEQENVTCEFRIFTIAITIMLALCLVFFLVPKIEGWITFRPLDADDVENITYCSECELSKAQVEEFIEIYNSSKYYGKERNYDTTSYYYFEIELKDGTTISLHEYGKLFIVSSQSGEKKTDTFYITNDKMDAFVENLRSSIVSTVSSEN